MELKEVKLSEPVAQHFIKQGYEVYYEIPCWQRCIDIVAIKKEGFVIAIELKYRYCKKAVLQAISNSLAADISYIAIGNKPRGKSLSFCAKYNIGVILVNNGIEILQEANQNKNGDIWKQDLIEICKRNAGNGQAGKPNLAGVGPAQECQRAVEKYLKQNPDATWKQIFKEVPNHYASPQSMRQSLDNLAYWQYLKKQYAGKTCCECSHCQGAVISGHILKKEGYCLVKCKNRRPTSKACINFKGRKANR